MESSKDSTVVAKPVVNRESASAQGKAATQGRILAAATELFIEFGYEGTRVVDVAERAGVSRATVFWHFSDKAGLFREAFSRLLAPFRESLERDEADLDPAQRLEAHLARSEQFARDHQRQIAAFLQWASESPSFRKTAVPSLLDLNQRFAGVLTQSVAEMVPPGYDPQRLATGLMLIFDASLLLSLFDTSPRAAEDRSAALRAIVSLLPRRD